MQRSTVIARALAGVLTKPLCEIVWVVETAERRYALHIERGCSQKAHRLVAAAIIDECNRRYAVVLLKDFAEIFFGYSDIICNV